MSEEPAEPPPETPPVMHDEIASDEHPLSRVLFSWTKERAFDRFLLACAVALCAVLAGLDLLVPRHVIGAADGLPVFFGVFGFVAFVLAVMSGWPLGRVLRRPENYYDKNAPPATKVRRDV